MTDKYYTPDILDIRIGYEYEYNTPTGWHKSIVKNLHTDRDGNGVSELHFYLENNDLRTPYLTKEQIETEGWKFIPSERYEYKFIKNILPISNYELYFIHAIFQTETESLLMIKDIYRKRDIYFGQAKSINEFRYITNKLLNIN